MSVYTSDVDQNLLNTAHGSAMHYMSAGLSTLWSAYCHSGLHSVVCTSQALQVSLHTNGVS